VTENAVVPVEPALPAVGRPWSDEDRAALARAVLALERPGLAARLSAIAGRPLDLLNRALPAPITEAVAKGTEAAMRGALKVALATLPKARVPSEPAPETAGTFRLRAFPARLATPEFAHRALAAASGAVGGAFGLATLAIELPVSTTIMLRAIADIARREGEDLADPETALACVQVFALGGRGSMSLADSGYFAVRGALARTMTEATRVLAQRGLVDEGTPALLRFAAQVAARFGVVVSQKAAAQAVPIVGALGGAAINAAFLDHFQTVAAGHFTVRRLERVYGREAVEAAYDAERERLDGVPAGAAKDRAA
jgi:hypothetical protein